MTSDSDVESHGELDGECKSHVSKFQGSSSHSEQQPIDVKAATTPKQSRATTKVCST